MGILDFFGGGSDKPAVDPSMAAMRDLGMPQSLIDAYGAEQEKNRKMQAMQMIIGGIGNAVSGYQGMAPVAAPNLGASGGGGGGDISGSMDGLLDRAMKFSQLRENISKREQAAAARAALPELARQLGLDPKVASAMDPSELSAMYRQKQMADFNANAEVRKQQALFTAAGITDPAEQQRLMAQGLLPKPEITNLKTPSGEVSVIRKPNAQNPNGFDLIDPVNGQPFTGVQRNWEQKTIELPEGKFTVNVRPNPQNPSGFDMIMPDGSPVDVAALKLRADQAAADKKTAETAAGVRGEKLASLPTTLNAFDETTSLVQKVLDDPSLPKAVGDLWDRKASLVPGTDAYGAAQRIEQLKSRTFLASVRQMAGMGSLSNAEGLKVEAAQARLNSAQNLKDFVTALEEMKVSLQRLREISLKEAGVSSASQGGNEWTTLENGVRIRRVQ